MEEKKIRPDKLLAYKHRKLPHWQVGGSWYFVTFRARVNPLPEPAKDMVKRFVESGHDKRFLLSVAVVMPDHAHLLLWPKEKYSGVFYSLNDILRPIKGASSRGINLFLGRRGPVWQKESFDRIIRNEREWREKYDYICNNPVKNGLAEKPNEYPWLVFGEQFINRY